ncbi:hypothetical protein G6F43_011384 [Rhizopus delemar]|nr:hypothetical protein G6F43_011384 [Rhizopus delemar]
MARYINPPPSLRPTTLLLQIALRDLVRSSMPWKETFDLFELSTENPIIVSFTDNIDFMQSFEVMGTCSTLPRIVTTHLQLEKEYDHPPATLIQKAIMVGGYQYQPKQQTISQQRSGTLSVDLQTSDEEQIEWTNKTTTNRDHSLSRELSTLSVANTKEEEEVLVFDFDNPEPSPSPSTSQKKTPTRHASFRPQALEKGGDRMMAYRQMLQLSIEVCYTTCQNINGLPCHRWNLPVQLNPNTLQIIVCQGCLKKLASGRPMATFTYPGLHFTDSYKLNYRERSALSPVKIMSQISRNTYCGHYQLTGSVWTEHNLEFIHLVHSGAHGLPFERKLMEAIDRQKVMDIFALLKQTNPFLQPYETPFMAAEMQKLYEDKLATHAGQHPKASTSWTHNCLMPVDDVHPNAAHLKFDDLILGTDIFEREVNYRDYPGVLCLIFPYLYTNGQGHYSFTSQPKHLLRSEAEGGLAQANRDHETLASYTKSRILMKDRRFGRCTEFIFFMMDMFEKHNIQSSNRHVISVEKDKVYNKGLVMQNNQIDYNQVSIVPHIIRSSYTYKRKHGLNLQALFQSLGPPQLFLTISCDDFASDYQAVCQVGGVHDWSWTSEIQDRGSPHVHIVLWTGKTQQELLDLPDLVVAQVPDQLHDPELHALVLKHQKHDCRPYCLRRRHAGDGPEPNQSHRCRFGFPFEPCPKS